MFCPPASLVSIVLKHFNHGDDDDNDDDDDGEIIDGIDME